MEDRRLSECTAYFESRPVYRKLFKKMREKYESLGHLGGAVQLTGLDEEELRQLGGFFQKDFTGKKSVTISYSAMEKALENSRFAGLCWERILQEYFGEELTAKKEQKLLEEERWNQYFEDILTGIPENPGTVWLAQTLRTRGDGYLLLKKQYREEPCQLRTALLQFLHAVSCLSFPMEAETKKAASNNQRKELLAVFAARTTGDPHFFDEGTFGEQLLSAYLKKHISDRHKDMGFRAEKKAGLFYEAGLLRDNLSNHVLTYGVRAWTRDGECHEGIDGFLHRREPVHLTLMTLGGLSVVKPQNGRCVYVVENPAVFSVLAKTWPDASVICGNGQIRLATLTLMDLFEEDIRFLYAGDYDPEGLLIAQRLRERYGKRLAFWNYSSDFYERYQSAVEISAKSLKKLDGLYLEELKPLKALMLREKRAAYQEAMLKEYFEYGR